MKTLKDITKFAMIPLIIGNLNSCGDCYKNEQSSDKNPVTIIGKITDEQAVERPFESLFDSRYELYQITDTTNTKYFATTKAEDPFNKGDSVMVKLGNSSGEIDGLYLDGKLIKGEKGYKILEYKLLKGEKK